MFPSSFGILVMLSQRGGGGAMDGLWTEVCGQQKQSNDPGNNQHIPQYANYWAPLTRKRHIPTHPAQPRHTNYWAPRTRKRHQQEHRPQRPTERSDPTQHAKGRTGDCPGPRKGATTRRHVTQGGGGGNGSDVVIMVLLPRGAAELRPSLSAAFARAWPDRRGRSGCLPPEDVACASGTQRSTRRQSAVERRQLSVQEGPWALHSPVGIVQPDSSSMCECCGAPSPGLLVTSRQHFGGGGLPRTGGAYPPPPPDAPAHAAGVGV